MRYIRHNKRSGGPTLLVALDTETVERENPKNPHQKINLLRLGCAIRFRLERGAMTRVERLTFADPRTFWDWLYAGLQSHKRCYLFTHNAGFDLTAVQCWKELEDGSLMPVWRKKIPEPDDDQGEQNQRWQGTLVIEDPPTILDLQSLSGHKVTILDLLNWLPWKLAEIGSALGLEKLPFPGDESTTAYWAEYCMRDAEIVAHAVIKLLNWVRSDDLGNFRYTLSGQSLSLYRHRCITEPIVWEHAECSKRMERRAAYAGRTRAYFLGCAGSPPGQLPGMMPEIAAVLGTAQTEAIYRLDVNSCYPFVMAENAYPTCYVQRLRKVSPARLWELLDEYEGAADVRVHSLAREYPYREKGTVKHCVGTFDTTLAGPELRTALADGAVTCVYAAQLYKRGRPFGEFSRAVLAMRERYRIEGDRLLYKASKTLANALYGKFGQWAGGWQCDDSAYPQRLWGHWPRKDPITGEVVAYRALGGNVQRKEPKCEKTQNFPLIYAYVCSYAREHMRHLKSIAGVREVFYEDVDSLHVSQLGYSRLESAGKIDPHRPGALKVEECVTSATWIGPKCYRLGEKWTLAGVSPHARKGDKGEWEQTQWYGLNVLLAGDPPEGPITETIQPMAPSPRNHGRLRPDGWLDWPVEGL